MTKIGAMPNQFYLPLAHIFGDPIIENSGLEGGQLENALSLLRTIITEVLKNKFPEHQSKLDLIDAKVKRCLAYLEQIQRDRIQGSKLASTLILQDLDKLSGNDFLLLPGGWSGRRVPGHAMLYLFAPNQQFIIINTGAGITYHPKQARPNHLRYSFFVVEYKDKKRFRESGIIESLMALRTQPADYYHERFIYELIIPRMGGKVINPYSTNVTYPAQSAGTCFWQCTERLMLYFFHEQLDIYQKMKLCWEIDLLNKLFNFYQNSDTQLSLSELTHKPWESFFRLVQFAIRHLSHHLLQTDYRYLSESEQQECLTKWQWLDTFSTQTLNRIPYFLDTRKMAASTVTVNLKSSIPNIENDRAEQPTLYEVQPIISYFPSEIHLSICNIASYCLNKNLKDLECAIALNHLLYQFFLYLPLPNSAEFNAINRNLQGDISQLAEAIVYCIKVFYQIQLFHFAKQMTPESYSKRLVVPFAAFCFLDGIMRAHPEGSVLNNYCPALTRFTGNVSLKEIAAYLHADHPRLAIFFQQATAYIDSLSTCKTIFEFRIESSTQLSSFDKPKFILETESSDIEFLLVVQSYLNRKNEFLTDIQSQFLDRTITGKYAYCLIDSERKYFPAIIHAWREISFYCRTLLSALSYDNNLVINNDQEFYLSSQQVNNTTQLQLDHYSCTNYTELHGEQFHQDQLDDLAIQELINIPWAANNENEFIVKMPPQSHCVNPDLYKQLASTHADPDIQVLTTLNIFTDHVVSLQFHPSRILLNRYVFQLGPNFSIYASLFLQEIRNNGVLPSILENLRQNFEEYFGGQISKLTTYLELVSFFVSIESFWVMQGNTLIMSQVYDKLFYILKKYPDHSGDIAAHLIILYKNYSLLTVQDLLEERRVVERLLISWSVLLHAKNHANLSHPKFYRQAKEIILGMSHRILNVLSDIEYASSILDIMFNTLVSESPLDQGERWDPAGNGCWKKADYFFNLFDGKLYYRHYPITELANEIVNHPDFKLIYKNSSQVIELARSTSATKFYRTIGQVKRLLVHSIHKPSEDYLENLLSQFVSSQHLVIVLQQPVWWGELNNSVLGKQGITAVWNNDNTNEWFIKADKNFYRIQVSSDHIERIYCLRFYGHEFYWQLEQIEHANHHYFSLADFNLVITSPDRRQAVINKQADMKEDLIIYEYMDIRGEHFWAQYTPSWRLAGLLPDYFMRNHTYWIKCDVNPNLDFMYSGTNSISLSNTDTQTLLVLDKDKKLVFIVSYNAVSTELFSVNPQGNYERKWLSLLNLSENSLLFLAIEALKHFELPTQIIAWQAIDAVGKIMIELPRFQLSFHWDDTLGKLHSLQYDGYTLVVDKCVYPIGNFPYKLELVNSYGEIIVILPHQRFISPAFLNNNPFSSRCYLNQMIVETPSYFAYQYQEEFNTLHAFSLPGKWYFANLLFRTRQYYNTIKLLESCWTDQALDKISWSLFLRFFNDNGHDYHPDAHTCRLKAYLLYLDNFNLIKMRRLGSDIVPSEVQQLKEFEALSSLIVKDVQLYLKKWELVQKSLRLSETEERRLLDSLNFENLFVEFYNRSQCIKGLQGALLKLPVLTFLQTNRNFLDKEKDLTEQTIRACYWLFGVTEVDRFGFYLDVPASIQQCFIFLYQALINEKYNANDIQRILTSIALFTKKNISDYDLFLLRLLYYISQQPLLRLPTLEPDQNHLGQYAVNLNVEHKARTKIDDWFDHLLQIYFYGENTLIIHRSTDMSACSKIENQEVTNFPTQQNTLPENMDPEILLFNKSISPDLLDRLPTTIKQPLADSFNDYFSITEVRVNQQGFPLNPTHGDKSLYSLQLKESVLAKNLSNQFQNSFSKYLATKHEKYDCNSIEALVNNGRESLFKKLEYYTDKKNKLLKSLLEKANRRINVKKSQFLSFSKQDQDIDLRMILRFFVSQDEHSIRRYNRDITTNDLKDITRHVYEYLATISILKQIKRVLGLIEQLMVINKANDDLARDSFIQRIGKEIFAKRHYDLAEHPLFLVFEAMTGCILWQEQIDLVEQLKHLGHPKVAQLIMGGGKSSVVAPLLAYLISNEQDLLFYTVPLSLVNMFAKTLQDKFNNVFPKRIHQFCFDRTTFISDSILQDFIQKFDNAQKHREVIVLSSEVPNSIFLKWIDLARKNRNPSLTNEVFLLTQLLKKLKQATQIVDEIDLVTDPMRSELNYTIGSAAILQPAPQRWIFAIDLLHALLNNKKLTDVLNDGLISQDIKIQVNQKQIKQIAELINVEYYHERIKRELAHYLLDEYFTDPEVELLIRKYRPLLYHYLLGDCAIVKNGRVLLYINEITLLVECQIGNHALQEKIHNFTDLLCRHITQKDPFYYVIDVSEFYTQTLQPRLAELLKEVVELCYRCNTDFANLLVLSKEWLVNILPHILQKTLHVDYGPYFEVINSTKGSTKTYSSHKKLSVPYLGKDTPSKRADFQQPDVIIGLTILHYFYDGLRRDELLELLIHLQSEFEKQNLLSFRERKAAMLFRTWQESAAGNESVEINQIDIHDETIIDAMYEKLRYLEAPIRYYLTELIFPKYMKVYSEKLSSNGYDLTSILFKVTKGFTGTLHNANCISSNLNFEPQASTDGSMLHTLCKAQNNQIKFISHTSDAELLQQIDFKESTMFIDAGGLITHFNNYELVHYILIHAPDNIQGVLFVDDTSQQMQVLRRDGQLLTVSECTIPSKSLFKYIDHAHTTGTDMPQNLNDKGVLTISSHMTLRDLFQGSKRLRQLGEGQSLMFFLKAQDAKQIRILLNLNQHADISVPHVLCWLFSKTIEKSLQELQLTSKNSILSIVRERAFQELFNKFSESNLPSSSSSAVQGNVTKRPRKAASNDLDLYLDVFVEQLNYQPISQIALASLKGTYLIFDEFRNKLESIFSHRLLNQYDRSKLEERFQHAIHLLPKLLLTRASLSNEIENQQVQSTLSIDQALANSTEHQDEQQRQQMGERQSHTQRFFKPSSIDIWMFPVLNDSPVTSFIIPYNHLSYTLTRQLQLVRFAEIFNLPLNDQLLGTKNFIYTEETTRNYQQHIKHLRYFLEIQEVGNYELQRYFIALSTYEAGEIRKFIATNSKDTRGFGIYLFPDRLIQQNASFKPWALPLDILVQLYFLNGITQANCPAHLHGAWDNFERACVRPIPKLSFS